MHEIIDVKYNRRALCEIMATALYGGIRYWCEVAEIQYAGEEDGGSGMELPKRIIIKPLDDEEMEGRWGVFDEERDSKPITITINDIQKAITMVASGIRLRPDIRDAILSGDAGNIDATAADVLVQVAAFRTVVFG